MALTSNRSGAKGKSTADVSEPKPLSVERFGPVSTRDDPPEVARITSVALAKRSFTRVRAEPCETDPSSGPLVVFQLRYCVPRTTAVEGVAFSGFTHATPARSARVARCLVAC